MGNVPAPSYIRTALPRPMYDLNSANEWMNGAGGSDRLHIANEDFFSSYNLFVDSYSQLLRDNSSTNRLNNIYIGNKTDGVTKL